MICAVMFALLFPGVMGRRNRQSNEDVNKVKAYIKSNVGVSQAEEQMCNQNTVIRLSQCAGLLADHVESRGVRIAVSAAAAAALPAPNSQLVHMLF